MSRKRLTTSVVIPVYSRSEELRLLAEACIASLDIERPDEVIVVDDGSPEKLRKIEGIDRLVALPENRGYVAAASAGMAVAQGDVVIVGNSDIIFFPQWMTHLLQPLREGCDISTIRTTEPDGWETSDRMEIEARFGCLFAISRGALDLLGGFDARFVHFFADTDLRRRALNLGIKIAKNHRGLVAHKGSATYSRLASSNVLYMKDRQTFIDVHGFLE